MNKRGFTLIELLIVIAIIGILAGIVLVNSKSSVDKAKQAAAMSSASSVLPELVTCADDSGAANSYSTSNAVCNATGHTTKWPDFTNTGYTTVSIPSSTIDDNFYFTVSNGTATIKCSYSTNGCCVVGTTGC